MAEHQAPSVKVQGRTYYVHRISLLISLKIQKIREAILKKLPEDVDAQTLLVVFYPILAGCTTTQDGEPVISPEGYLEMDPEEANAWYVAALALNPSAFSAPEGVASETEAKKETEQTTSTSG